MQNIGFILVSKMIMQLLNLMEKKQQHMTDCHRVGFYLARNYFKSFNQNIYSKCNLWFS